MFTFRSKTILDPDGNLHHNPRFFARGRSNLRREHAPFLYAISALFLAAAVFFGYRQYNFEQHAVKTDGVVIRVESKNSSSKKNRGLVYRDIVAYSGPAGDRHEIAGNSWSSSPSTVGSKVSVFYDPKKPEQASFGSGVERFAITVILAAFAVLMGAMAAVAQIFNPGTGSYLNIDGKVWRDPSGAPIPHTVSRTSISFGKKD